MNEIIIMEFEDEIEKGVPIYLGIIGSRADIKQQDIQDILMPIL